MIRNAIVDYVYNKYFADLFEKKELGGESIASNVVNAIVQPAFPLSIELVRDEAGKPVLATKEATALCYELGVDLFIIDVQENLAYINDNPKISNILSSKPILLTAQEELKLLLAVAKSFDDVELLRQPVEDPTNGGVMRSEDAFKYLDRCYQAI